jgi:phosphoketolase
MPYGIAVAPKGAGFYNEGTNYAHNLPLVENPHSSEIAASRFNAHASKLFVDQKALNNAITLFAKHKTSKRVKERDNTLANRDVSLKKIPDMPKKIRPKDGVLPEYWKQVSPMDAIDDAFLSLAKANPHLRPRIGNPDEMRSNCMGDTLDALEFRVVEPEEGAEESTLGSVITALNEEAVAAAAFGNKGGINIIVTYEAFGAKMFGEARQEVIFSKHKKDHKTPSKWLSVPIILTSNTWENSKNELSHQDPSLAESMFAETSDISRVVFPADYNSASAAMEMMYQTQGHVFSVVVPKRKTPLLFSVKEAASMVKQGGGTLDALGFEQKKAELTLVAIGAYQLAEVVKASIRLTKHGVPHRVSYIFEPGRFRAARNEGEKKHLASEKMVEKLLPKQTKHVVLATHTRPELLVGALTPLWQGRSLHTHGFINEGGTLDVSGMLYVNKCSWAHLVASAAEALSLNAKKLFSKDEWQALSGQRSPDGIITGL